MVNLNSRFADAVVTLEPPTRHKPVGTCPDCASGELHRHSDGTWRVASSTFARTGTMYTVTPSSRYSDWKCNCADQAFRGLWGGCKHIREARAEANHQWYAEHPEYFRSL